MRNYLKIAESVFKIASVSGDEASAYCIFHNDSSPSLSFNIKKGLYICHGCGAKGSAEQLVQDQRALSHDIGSNLELLHAQVEGLQKPKSHHAQEEFVAEALLNRYRFRHAYWKRRGFDEDTIDWWDLGYDPISNRLTIPIRDTHGSLLGVTYRRLDNNHPKYLYPRGFVRSRNLFGAWKITPKHGTACLVEGSIDAIRVWQSGYPALAIYGSSVTELQVRVLHKLGLTRVVCFFDNDQAGFKATSEVKEKVKRIEVAEVKWPRKFAGRDPGSLPLPAIKKLIERYFDDTRHSSHHT